MIWVKRLAPPLLLVAAWFIYSAVEQRSEAAALEYDIKIAELSAHLYIATAVYRDDSKRYVEYRDSLMQAFGVTREEIESYPELHEDNPEGFSEFVKLLRVKVDSLVRLEDSTLAAALNQADSSARAVTPRGFLGRKLFDSTARKGK